MNRIFVVLSLVLLLVFTLPSATLSQDMAGPFERRIVVLPFADLTGNPTAVEAVWTEVVRAFRQNGFEVAQISYVKAFLSNRGIAPGQVVPGDAASDMAGLFGVEGIVSGQIAEWRSSKKFKGAALLSGGAVLYGTVGLNVKMENHPGNGVTFVKSVVKTKKRQFLGAVQSHAKVMHDALVEAVGECFGGVFSR